MDADSYNAIYKAVKAARQQGGFIYACSFLCTLLTIWFAIIYMAVSVLAKSLWLVATFPVRVVYDFLNMTYVVCATYVRVSREESGVEK